MHRVRERSKGKATHGKVATETHEERKDAQDTHQPRLREVDAQISPVIVRLAQFHFVTMGNSRPLCPHIDSQIDERPQLSTVTHCNKVALCQAYNDGRGCNEGGSMKKRLRCDVLMNDTFFRKVFTHSTLHNLASP